MKTLYVLFAAIALGITSAAARSLEIKVPNVRSDKGNILAMVQTQGAAKPLYGMAADTADSK